jgi:hypothetical protein
MAAPMGFLTEEQRKLMRSASYGREAMVDESSKLMRSVSHGHHTMPEAALGAGGTKNSNAGASVEAKLDRRSNSGKNGRPKKGLHHLSLEFLVSLLCLGLEMRSICLEKGSKSVAYFVLMVFLSLI